MRNDSDRAPRARPAGAMALVGLWHDVPDDEIDELLRDLRAARDRDTPRPVRSADVEEHERTIGEAGSPQRRGSADL